MDIGSNMANSTDLMNVEISLGSNLKDVLSALQGAWVETEKFGWKISKLGAKFGIAVRNVEQGNTYQLPVNFTNELTACLFIGDNEISSSLIHNGQEAIYAPITGVGIIILK